MEDVFHHCNTFAPAGFSCHSSDPVVEMNQNGVEILPRGCCFTWLNKQRRERSLFMLLRENANNGSKRMHPLWLLDLHLCPCKQFLIYGTPLSSLYYNIPVCYYPLPLLKSQMAKGLIKEHKHVFYCEILVGKVIVFANI